MTRTTTLIRLLLGAVLCMAAAVLSACQGGDANKAGASAAEHTVTLILQMPDAGDPQGEFFARAVERRSGGSVRIRVDSSRYPSGTPARELALARALKAGKEDMGYVPARAWAADGVGAFKALLAPFAITTHSASQSVATGAVGRQVLAALPKSVVGVALVPAEPRRVIANQALTSPAAFDGLRVRIVDNPQSAADFTALGAHPVQGLSAEQVKPALRSQSLDAVESAPGPVLDNLYYRDATYLSAYAVFPKFQAIVVSRGEWDRLSDDQRSAIQAAAEDAVANGREQVPVQEKDQLAHLCAAGVHLSHLSDAQLQSLASAAQPAADALASDPAADGVLEAIQAMPGSGPQRMAGPLPAACTRPGNEDRPQEERVHRGPATIPNGTYVTVDTEADMRRGDVTNPELLRTTTVTTTMRDGRWYQTMKPTLPDQGPWKGTYEVKGNRLTFAYESAGKNQPVSEPDELTWSYFNGQLRFKIVDVIDPGSRVLYIAHPWKKVR